MAETLLSFGVQTLCDLLARESRRLEGFDEQFDVLKWDLNKLKSFLKDADAKKHSVALVKTCVEEIKEIVLDAEDLIETFLLKKEIGDTSIMKCMRIFCILFDRWKIASDIGGISKRISKVICDMQNYGVVVDSDRYSRPVQQIQREMRKTFPSNNENVLVGLEDNVKKLVGYLVEEDIQVVSICGMGGIGKTTLAREVFNHEIVQRHFDGVVWVCISQQFTRSYVWHMILPKLSSKHVDTNMTEEDLQEKLFQLLETSSSLIVLDDMWREEDWDRIKPVFRPKKGWKVLLISRNENVALHVDPKCDIFKPECLNLEESWTLFRRIAFPRNDIAEFKVDEIEEMGRKMIKHCGGLPLALKVLGGLLTSKHTLSDWKRISNDIRSQIVGGISFNGRNMSLVYHILYLSFEELHVHLKHCFLYLAHFPEDHPIRVRDLSYYLAAEEISRPMYYNGATIEEVGNGYIEELVKRNMVKRDVSPSGFETCHMHDMLREVCLRKAEEENFVHVVDNANSQSPCKSRRMAVHSFYETYNPEGEMMNPKLRSLLFLWNHQVYGHYVKSGLWFTRLQLMRVLDLTRVDFGGELPSSIGKLIHLRYLSLFEAMVTHLPSSMRNLKQLLYLNLTTRRSTYIPNFLKELQELAYLSLPQRMHDKTKLELDGLVNLEMLVNFSTKHSNVEDLHQMRKLRNLSIYIRGEGFATEILSSSLSELRHLEDLSIYGSSNGEEGFVLDCAHLKKLHLSIYMPMLPDEQHFPSHLTTIYLQYCGLEEDPMRILEKLLHLKEVKFKFKSFIGRKMVCSGGGFPQLQELSINGLEKWEEWIVKEGSMPLLHSLDISDCPKLNELPDGLKFITSLKNLTMDENLNMERFLEGGEDYYKVKHIPSVKFYYSD